MVCCVAVCVAAWCSVLLCVDSDEMIPMNDMADMFMTIAGAHGVWCCSLCCSVVLCVAAWCCVLQRLAACCCVLLCVDSDEMISMNNMAGISMTSPALMVYVVAVFFAARCSFFLCVAVCLYASALMR